jgi:hypothetical protein
MSSDDEDWKEPSSPPRIGMKLRLVVVDSEDEEIGQRRLEGEEDVFQCAKCPKVFSLLPDLISHSSVKHEPS